jgi:hypothetical protein
MTPAQPSTPSLPPWLALTSLAIVLAGCVTGQRVLQDRGKGEVRCYRASFERVWGAAERGVRWTGLEIEVADTAQGHVLARSYEPEVQDPERMAVDADAGERVGVFIDSAGADLWAVEVVSRRVFALDISARDWTNRGSAPGLRKGGLTRGYRMPAPALWIRRTPRAAAGDPVSPGTWHQSAVVAS